MRKPNHKKTGRQKHPKAPLQDLPSFWIQLGRVLLEIAQSKHQHQDNKGSEEEVEVRKGQQKQTEEKVELVWAVCRNCNTGYICNLEALQSSKWCPNCDEEALEQKDEGWKANKSHIRAPPTHENKNPRLRIGGFATMGETLPHLGLIISNISS